MKKVWCIHAKCGSGHTMAAKAVYEHLSKDEFFDAEIIDILDEGKLQRFIFEEGYRFVVKHAPFIWKLMYDYSEKDFFRKTHNSSPFFSKLIKRIKKENPDFIVSTHFAVSEIVSHLIEQKLIKTKLITVVTDYNVHASWINKNTHFYVVASDFTAQAMHAKFSVETEKVKVWGIPVREHFLGVEQKEISERINALIFSSDFGMGPFHELVHSLKDKCNMTVLCGRDEKLKSSLKNLEWTDGLVVKGVVSDIWELMKKADIVVMKAGGLSVSECLRLKKPMVFMQAIYGQETENIRFVINNGLGFWPQTVEELIELLNNLIKNRKMLYEVAENYKKINLPNTCEKIAQYIKKLNDC